MSYKWGTSILSFVRMTDADYFGGTVIVIGFIMPLIMKFGVGGYILGLTVFVLPCVQMIFSELLSLL